jgi:hypothetical protein
MLAAELLSNNCAIAGGGGTLPPPPLNLAPVCTGSGGCGELKGGDEPGCSV